MTNGKAKHEVAAAGLDNSIPPGVFYGRLHDEDPRLPTWQTQRLMVTKFKKVISDYTQRRGEKEPSLEELEDHGRDLQLFASWITVEQEGTKRYDNKRKWVRRWVNEENPLEPKDTQANRTILNRLIEDVKSEILGDQYERPGQSRESHASPSWYTDFLSPLSSVG
jgi:hypothetical protein